MSKESSGTVQTGQGLFKVIERSGIQGSLSRLECSTNRFDNTTETKQDPPYMMMMVSLHQKSNQEPFPITSLAAAAEEKEIRGRCTIWMRIKIFILVFFFRCRRARLSSIGFPLALVLMVKSMHMRLLSPFRPTVHPRGEAGSKIQKCQERKEYRPGGLDPVLDAGLPEEGLYSVLHTVEGIFVPEGKEWVSCEICFFDGKLCAFFDCFHNHNM